MKHWAVALAVLAALVAPRTAAAGDGAEAKQVVARAVEEAFQVLRDPALQKQDARPARVRKLRTIADGVFDWREMAQRSLGPPWRDLDPAQRERFTSLLEELLASSYLDDIDVFRGDERVEVLAPKVTGDEVEVPTVLRTHSGDTVPISYFLHETSDGWRIHDFSIEGISIVDHYRASFRRFLANHTFDELLQRLDAAASPP